MSQEAPAQYNYDKRRLILGLVAIFLVYGVIGYIFQAMNNVRPEIAGQLDGMKLIPWSVSIPGLIGAFVTLIYGKLSDMYGRRIMLLISVSFALVGSIFSALSTTFVFFIVATSIGSFGIGAIMPLVFAVLGDMFPPVQRSKWVGLLQIPMGIAALGGPALAGWFADTLGWQYFFWSTVPLLIICLILVPIGIPPLATRGIKRKIDIRGSLLVTVASSTTVIGLLLGGEYYPWGSIQIIGLFGISIIFWILFFRAEYGVEEPVLDPLVLHNRSFNIVAAASLLSFFGQMAMMIYFPIFLQGVLGVSGKLSGWYIAPLGWLMAFIGVPVGFLLARTRRYKWMYNLGYGIITATMFGITLLLSEDMHVVYIVLACTMAGLGLGAIPTVNTMVVQNAVPKRLLGAAMGAIFFCLMFGVAISPAILGTVELATYNKTLDASLPDGLEHMTDLIDSKVLQSEQDMAVLENAFREMGSEGEALFRQTVDAIRSSVVASIKSVFWIGAITMLMGFLLIITVPEVPIGEGPSD